MVVYMGVCVCVWVCVCLCVWKTCVKWLCGICCGVAVSVVVGGGGNMYSEAKWERKKKESVCTVGVCGCVGNSAHRSVDTGHLEWAQESRHCTLTNCSAGQTPLPGPSLQRTVEQKKEGERKRGKEAIWVSPASASLVTGFWSQPLLMLLLLMLSGHLSSPLSFPLSPAPNRKMQIVYWPKYL